MAKLPFQKTDPAQTSFQFLEDLSTAYWYSEVLFSAIELGLFDCIQEAYPTTSELASLSSCKVNELARMLPVLEQMELVKLEGERWYNSQVTMLYLTSQSNSYMGNFLLYRRYMQSGWQTLTHKVSEDGHHRQTSFPADQDYATKTYNYVRAMDQLAAQKAKEIITVLNPAAWKPPLLDIGGGAGSLGRGLLRSQESCGNFTAQEFHADLLELEEVLTAAKGLYTDRADWRGINMIKGDFRHHAGIKQYGLIVLSNFLHAYGPSEAQELLHKAVSLLSPGGMILVHDYFPDRLGTSPSKGPFYDLAMMLNTYNGRCHKSTEVVSWLQNSAMTTNEIRDLDTDSTIIVSVQDRPTTPVFTPGRTNKLAEWPYIARQEGFARAAVIESSQIVTGSWVRKKCQYGCERFGKNLQCPPNGMDGVATREMLDSFSFGILVEGMPPGREFHDRLLAMEKRAFLSGYHKALAFTAGHCPVCDSCPEDAVCRFPGRARPSMEASGIDVYETAHRAGFLLQPVLQQMNYVKYFGLLMLE